MNEQTVLKLLPALFHQVAIPPEVRQGFECAARNYSLFAILTVPDWRGRVSRGFGMASILWSSHVLQALLHYIILNVINQAESALMRLVTIVWRVRGIDDKLRKSPIWIAMPRLT
jgi:hypothetical protein